MNVGNLFTHSGVYARNMDDWECKPAVEQTYFNLRPFVQAAYQRCLASGVITATVSGYASNNCFAGLTTATNVSDNGTAETVVKSINTHMANLSASILLQSNTSNNANTAIFNTPMQQITANDAQCNNNHDRMLQQFAMMMTNPASLQHFAWQVSGQPTFQPQAATQRDFVPDPHVSPSSAMGPTSRKRRLWKQPFPQRTQQPPPAWTGTPRSSNPLCRW
jgi:hypothetical protein